MNYNELCEELNIKTDYKHKVRHIEMLRKQYDIVENENNDYDIIRKRSEVERVEFNQSMKKNRTYIEPLLYTYLGMQEDSVLIVRMSQLLERLSCVNEDYYPIKYNTKDAQNIIDPDRYGLNLFMSDSEPVLKQIVYDVLRDMKRKSLISIEYLPTTCKSVETDSGEVLYPLTILSDANRNKFLRAQQVGLEQLGYKYIDDVKFYDFKTVKNIIAKEMNCLFVCYTYKIIINLQGLKKYTLEDFWSMKKSFNQYIMQKIRIDDKHYNYLDETEKGLYIDYCISLESCKHIGFKIKKVF